MNPPLVRCDPYAERLSNELKRMLPAAPWIWPRPNGSAKDTAIALGCRRPHSRIGEALLVSVNERGASLWCISLPTSISPVSGTHSAVLVKEALQSWTTAETAVSRSLAVLWTAPGPALAPRHAVRLGSLAREHHSATLESALDGRSFGLSFFLALASASLGVPVRRSIAASAEIDPEGRLRPVDDETLADKLTVVADLAPTVRTFVVAAEQVQLARQIVASLKLPIVVRGAHQADATLAWALGIPPLRLLIDAGNQPSARHQILENLFQLTVRGRKTISNWTPVREAATIARSRWSRLSADERWYLGYVAAVAERHERNHGRIPAFNSTIGRRRSAAERLSIVANYVQHSTDTGKPGRAEILAIAKRHVVRVRDAHATHAKIFGSLGRLYASCGQLREGLRCQRQAVLIWFGANQHGQASHQFAEWYRVAGALRSKPELAAADMMAAGVPPDSLDHTSAAYMRLGRCQALVGLARAAEATDELQRLANDSLIPVSPRSSAIRWLVRSLEESDRAEEAALLTQSSQILEKHRVLITLDRALRQRDALAASKAVGALKRADQGPMTHVLAAAPSATLARARFVQRHYPY